MRPRVLLVLLSALTLSSCAPPGTYRKMRSSIRTLAIERLGPADRYDIHTSRDGLSRLKRGLISRVEVHGVNVRPAPGYVLDDLFVSAKNVRVNRRAKTVEGAEETSAVGWLSEQSLASMVALEGTVKDPTVSIKEGGVEISGQYSAFGALPMSITAVGKARLKGIAGVEFVSDSVTAAGIPMPLNITRTFDLAPIYPALVLTSVTTENGRAVLTGTLDWAKINHG